MEEIDQMPFEEIFNLIGKIAGGFIIGAFCGVVPLVLGIIIRKGYWANAPHIKIRIYHIQVFGG